MREDLPLFGIPATITRMGCPGIPLSVHWAILSESRRRKSGVNCPMPFPPLQSAAITAAPCFRNQSIHRAVAASSALMLVDSPRSSSAREKDSTAPVAMPSCPAASATAAISVVVAGISVDIRLMPSEMAASCSGVPSTVLYTPVRALSNSMEASTQAVINSVTCSSAIFRPPAASAAANAPTASFASFTSSFACFVSFPYLSIELAQ